jgi:hypothetical protein
VTAQIAVSLMKDPTLGVITAEMATGTAGIDATA